MKLFRLSIIVGDTTVERGVWADNIRIADGCYFFRDEYNELLQSYPTQYTFITNIETKEEYDARKAK
jgi:hypothetical protein